MKGKIKILLISVIIITIGLNLTMYVSMKISQYNTRKLFEKVYDHKKLYVYETYFGDLNAALYTEDINDTNLLITYYSKIAKKDTDVYITSGKMKFMPISLHQPIYVYRYLTKGSNIVELIDFNTKCWGYITGYLYTPTTHVDAPPDSLVKKKEEYIAKENSNKSEQIDERIYKKLSQYGWYCDN